MSQPTPTSTSKLSDALAGGLHIAQHRPWRRIVVEREVWHALSAQLAEGRFTLLGLWGERAAVHMALLDDDAGRGRGRDLPLPAWDLSLRRTAPCAGDYASSARSRICSGSRPPACPICGRGSIMAAGAFAIRCAATATPRVEAGPYVFLAAEGEGLHQIAVGPVHAGIIEPGHFRFTANGETIVRLEERLGYVHKGIESLMAGASLEQAGRLAGRTSGDSTVAYAFAFARAVEAALGIDVPPRAVWLRALMAELERLANHLGDIGAICNDAAFALMHAHCAMLREHVLRTAASLLRSPADDGRHRRRRRRRRSRAARRRAHPLASLRPSARPSRR